jgi:hypothetical protein
VSCPILLSRNTISIHNSQPFTNILTQTNPASFQHSPFQIICDVSSSPASFDCHLSLSFSEHNSAWITLLSNACYLPHPPDSWSVHHNIISCLVLWRRFYDIFHYSCYCRPLSLHEALSQPLCKAFSLCSFLKLKDQVSEP